MTETKNPSTSQANKKNLVDEAHRKNLIAEQKKSGLTQKQFVKGRGISLKTFGRWKSQLEPSQKEPISPQTNQTTPMAGNKATTNIPPVASAKQPEGQKNTFGDRIELQHVSGFRVVFDAQTNEGLLRKVLKTLSELTND